VSKNEIRPCAARCRTHPEQDRGTSHPCRTHAGQRSARGAGSPRPSGCGCHPSRQGGRRSPPPRRPVRAAIASPSACKAELAVDIPTHACRRHLSTAAQLLALQATTSTSHCSANALPSRTSRLSWWSKRNSGCCWPPSGHWRQPGLPTCATRVLVTFRPAGRTPEVVRDPRSSFGQPSVRGVRTDVVAEDFHAGETLESLAALYDLDLRQVDQAIRYEMISSAAQAG
jgi:uncharacterized protein (DUF433 family)